jgi:hypothetical protein
MRRLLPIIFILCVFSPVFAQDATVEPTPESTPIVIVTPAPTPAPAPVLTPDNAIGVSTILYGLIIAVLGGGTVGFVLNKFGGNKANLDAAEKLYLSQSPEAQERERQLFMALRDVTLRVLDIVDKVTDGQPNAEVQALPSTINIHADDNKAAADAVKSFIEAVRKDGVS